MVGVNLVAKCCWQLFTMLNGVESIRSGVTMSCISKHSGATMACWRLTFRQTQALTATVPLIRGQDSHNYVLLFSPSQYDSFSPLKVIVA